MDPVNEEAATEAEFYATLAADMYAAAFQVYQASFAAVGSHRRGAEFSAYECAHVVACVQAGANAAARARLVPIAGAAS